MSRDFPLVFYNLDNNRDPAQAEKEIRAICNGPRPAILGLCETIGYADLPGVEGYRLIRDRSKPGRDNISAYVKTNLDLSDISWWDLKEQWTKPKDPPNKHWPRSILEFRAGRLKVLVAHAPPQNTDNVYDSQMEHCDKLSARMAPWTRDDWDEKSTSQQTEEREQARVCLWDANRAPGVDGPGPTLLADRTEGGVSGKKIDCANWSGAEVIGGANVSYPTTVNGVRLQSDHDHAFKFTLRLEDY